MIAAPGLGFDAAGTYKDFKGTKRPIRARRPLQDQFDRFWMDQCLRSCLRSRYIQSLQKQEMSIAIQVGKVSDDCERLQAMAFTCSATTYSTCLSNQHTQASLLTTLKRCESIGL
jgi:hypothetical protein